MIPTYLATCMGELVSKQAMANTYNSQIQNLTPWEYVQQYQTVRAYAAENPDKGSYQAANELEIPRGRIRGWVRDDPVVPDALRGMQTAVDNGWLPITWDDDEQDLAAWNTLMAGIFAGGSLNVNFVPQWAPGRDDERIRIRAALRQLGLDSRVERTDETNRATEVIPETDAAVFGHVLAAVGAPVGPKAELDELHLPDYLESAPDWMRAEFTAIYLSHRAECRFPPEDETTGIRLQEKRPSVYLDELAALFESVTRESVTRPAERQIFVSATAVEYLAQNVSRGQPFEGLDRFSSARVEPVD
jgi:hypothetical protein